MRFEDLEVWKMGARLSADVFRGTRAVKDFGFRDQVTRAGLSIPSNIAEGYERGSHPDFIRFLNYAKASCGELRTQIYIGVEIDYIDRQTGNDWIERSQKLSRMLASLIKARKDFIEDNPDSDTEPRITEP